MIKMPPSPRPRSLTALAALATLAALTVGGCGLFIHPTPISDLAEPDREVVAQRGGAPQVVRLTRPAKVGSFDLAAGSLVAADGRDFRIQTAQEIAVSGVAIPAGSWFELKKANSIITGDRYNWNGVVHLGGPQAYGMIQAQAGDRAYFTGSLFSNAQLTQLAIATPRLIGGRMLPAGSIIDLRENGQIQETFTPGEQQQLAHDREVRRQERERHEQRCKEVCAPVTDFAENSKCMANCRN
jgi:hypothetical protein